MDNLKWFVFVFIVFFQDGFSQSKQLNFKEIDTLLKYGKNFSAMQAIDSYDTLRLKKNDVALLYFYKAKAFLAENNHDKAFFNFIKSKRDYIKMANIDKAMSINLDIATLLSTNKDNLIKAEKYVEEYLEYALKQDKSLLIANGYSAWASLIMEERPDESLQLYRKAEYFGKKAKNDKQFATLYSNLGVFYNEILQKQDSAIIYIDKSIAYCKKTKNSYGICINLINKASCYYYKDDFKKAIKLLEEANTIKISKDNKNIKSYIYEFLAENYNALQDFKSAYEHVKKSIGSKEEFYFNEQNTKISEFNIKYETKEKEVENLKLKTKIQQNRLILFAVLGLLCAAVILTTLIYKNLSKKKKIAEQAQLIQAQKLEKTLKDRELHDIDLMLKSQEIERQQIANELHDNLGSLLATLKLNFQNLNKLEHPADQKLFEKTDALLEETYQKVRNIAHLKNMGIIGKEGLLVAVKMMAEKMTVINRLKINVIPFGLTQRLSNTTEVTLFRIIQELCTNIIKHSKADEVTLYLTQHNSELINIIIEDNGKGFDYKLVIKKDGIGLKSIEQKVEQMGGTFTVDSVLSKGTTIIIDLPL